VSLVVRPGTVHCLVGGNGSGKSTLFKVLAGVYRGQPGGAVTVFGQHATTEAISPEWARRAGLRFVHQDLAIFPEMSVAENLAVGSGYPRHRFGNVAWRRLRKRSREVLDRFGLDVRPTTPVADLRPAERTLLAVARALQDQDAHQRHVLILDEPTAALPEAEASALLSQLRTLAGQGQAIVFVSHRLDEVLKVADDVSVLRDGRMVGRYAVDDLDHDRLVELIVGEALAEQSSALRESGPVALTARSLHGQVLRDVSFALRSGEVIGVAGIRGSGRSELLRLLGGVQNVAAGTIEVATAASRAPTERRLETRGVVYLPEDRDEQAGFPDLSVRENLLAGTHREFWRRGILSRRNENKRARGLCRDFVIKADSPEQSMMTLSGGNRQKVVLARLLNRDPSVLLLDEPTQGVDVGARAEIHRIISNSVSQGAGAVVVSSDIEELVEISDRIIVLADGAVAGELRGDDINVARVTSAAHRLQRTA
jgi:ribose transport system ATP-binding protein